MNGRTPTARRTIKGPYPGEVVGYEGTSPGADPTYTLDVHFPEGVKRYTGVRPQSARFDRVALDEDAAAIVDPELPTVIATCWLRGDELVAAFDTLPAVGCEP